MISKLSTEILAGPNHVSFCHLSCQRIRVKNAYFGKRKKKLLSRTKHVIICKPTADKSILLNDFFSLWKKRRAVFSIHVSRLVNSKPGQSMYVLDGETQFTTLISNGLLMQSLTRGLRYMPNILSFVHLPRRPTLPVETTDQHGLMPTGHPPG